MIQADDPAAQDHPNHPLAVRMGVIAGVSHNVVVGSIMGSFGVMLASVEQRMGVAAEQASAGIPLVLVASAILGPIAGVLAAKVSLRLLLLAGALLAAAGFLILGLTTSYPLYLLAYGLCLGPAMSLGGSVGPATLVARWFSRNRGLAMGLVHLSIVIAILPVALNWFLERNGALAAYLALAVLPGLVLAPLTLLTVDHPPGGETVAPEPSQLRTADGSFSVGQLLRRPRFWMMCLAAAASTVSSVMLGSLLVPMGVSWGFTRGESALLASTMSLGGIFGSVLFGLIVDRLGGGRTLALICFDCVLLWSLLLFKLPFAAAALVVGLIGVHGAGVIPTLGRGLSDAFGQASFSRCFGLFATISLPFLAVAIIGSARVSSATGSFAPAIMAIVVFFAVGVVFGLLAARGPKAGTVAPAPAAG